MRASSRWFAVLVLGVLCSPATAQQPPAGNQADDPGAEVRLQVHDGRTQFRLDEPIKLELVFIRYESGYTVNSIDYGDIYDAVNVTPAEGWFRSHGQSGHDYVTSEPLGGVPIIVPVLLNQAIVFQKPGHYEVSITTGRLSSATGSHLRTTNTVGLDITAPNEQDEQGEAALVQSLSAEIAGPPGKARHQAALRLSYLAGDDAVRAKIHWLLAADQNFDEKNDRDNIRGLMLDGLASSRNLQLQLDLLQAAWRDPQRAPAWTLEDALQQTRAFLRRQTIPGWVMGSAPATDPDAIQAEKQMQQDQQHDLSELIDTLPLRTGANRAETAYYLMESTELSDANLARVRPVVIEDFGSMDTGAQSMLLDRHWQDIRDPALAPALRTMLDAAPEGPMNGDALQRLIEISPEIAVSYVVRAICDPKSDVPARYVADLPEPTLQAVDSCLATELNSWPGNNDLRFRAKVLLAARFGSEALLPVVREVYATRAGKFPRQHDGPFLAYLLRYAPKEAMPQIETLSGSDVWIAFMDIDKVFAARNVPFPAELQAWLRLQVGQADKGNKAAEKNAVWAASELSRFGSAADKGARGADAAK